MTTKKEQTSEKQSRVKVGKLKLNKETVQELNDRNLKEVKGGGGACRGQRSGTEIETCDGLAQA